MKKKLKDVYFFVFGVYIFISIFIFGFDILKYYGITSSYTAFTICILIFFSYGWWLNEMSNRKEDN